MVSTGWKKALDKCGRSQRSTAQALSVNLAELSMVAQGRAFLTPEKFDRACELLGCRPTDLYSDDVLSLLYGMDTKPKRKRGVRVELDDDLLEFIDIAGRELVGEGATRTKAVNTMIRMAKKGYEGEEI